MTNINSEKKTDWLFDGPGEMRAFCRDLDWTSTQLGEPHHWPQSLRTAAQMVLSSPFPNIVLWGPEFLQIYNDGYREIMANKHPTGFGISYRDCWPEVWHINRPIYERVWAGESFSFEDTLYPLERLGEIRDFWLTLAYSPILNEQGKIAGVLVTVFDTTATVLEQRRREKAEFALRQSNRRKDEFLAMLAHELRNPMATVRNGLAVLSLTDTNSNPVLEQTVKLMNRQVDHLVRMVDDLLDISRITENKVDLVNEYVNVASLVEDAVNVMNSQFSQNGKKLHLAEASKSLTIFGDATRLTQVITNLLVNGIRYTGNDGQVWVSFSREGEEVVIRVADNGIGLLPEQTTSIFELFVQGDSSLARSQGGLGIGLTMVQQLVTLHGGRVEARSPGLGLGSEFLIYLPLSENLCEDSVTPKQPLHQSLNKRILVIDDNADAAQTLSMLLKLKGYDVESRNGGLQGIEAAEHFLPEVILCDIGMPEIDGYETAKQIRQKTWGKSFILIALTGYGQEDDKLRALNAGFDEHLTKPVDLKKLLNLINSLLSKNTLSH